MFSYILSTKNYSPEINKLTRNYFLLSIFGAFINSLPAVFFSLYLIDKFDYAFAGILFTIMSISQFVFDYPTGALSDYLGQKKVQILASITYSISMILMYFAQSSNTFIVIMILLGLSAALFSGVIQTWFSNNYHVLMPEDTERDIYGSIMARVRSYTFLTVAISIFVGSTLATWKTRQFVFLLNGLLGLFGIILIVLFLNDFYPKESGEQEFSPIQHVRNYLKLTFESLLIVIKDRLLLSTFWGLLLLSASLGPVFIQLIYYPLVFGYTGTDAFIGLSQFAVYFVLAINVFFIGIFAKKFQRSYMPIFFILYVFFFLNGLLLLFKLDPPTKTLNITAVIVIILLFLFFDSFVGEIAVNLQQRIFLDLIPSKYRNSILSLYSSLMAITIALFYALVGFIVQDFNLDGGILFMELTGLLGCIFLLPILFSSRMSKRKLPQ